MSIIQFPSPGGRWHEWTRADRLRAARESLPGRPDHKAFAAISRIGRNTIGKYERHDYTGYTKRTVALWAAATGFDFDWLWDGTVPEDGPASPSPDGGITSSDECPRQDSNLRPSDYRQHEREQDAA